MPALRLLLSVVAGLVMTVLAGMTAVGLGDFIHAPIAAEYFGTPARDVSFPVGLLLLYLGVLSACIFGASQTPKNERNLITALGVVCAAPGHAYAVLVILLSGAAKGVA